MAWESTNRRFVRRYGTIHAPDGVQAGRLSSLPTVFNDLMTKALQFDVDWAPGESRTWRLAAGLAGLETGTIAWTVDGKPVAGHTVPLFPPGTAHRIQAVLKKNVDGLASGQGLCG